MTSESFCNYYRDKINMMRMKTMLKILRSKARKQQQVNLLNIRQTKNKKQTKITPENDNTLDTEFVVPLRYLSIFWSLYD